VEVCPLFEYSRRAMKTKNHHNMLQNRKIVSLGFSSNKMAVPLYSPLWPNTVEISQIWLIKNNKLKKSQFLVI
jgi:hypothetical protein